MKVALGRSIKDGIDIVEMRGDKGTYASVLAVSLSMRGLI
jgi:hypothetical protein